jgi:adenosylcobinamide kinase/adenosylcobinamide-phosphate guanylyltransferase
MRTLVLGGARSGKSAFAESLLDPGLACRYVATGEPGAEEGGWAARLAAHRARRPAGWVTVESLDLAGLLAEGATPLLVDSLGSWLARVADRDRLWGGEEAAFAPVLDGVARAWAAAPGRVVAVSEEVGLGVVPASAAGGLFRDVLGTLNRLIAAASEEVFLVVAGLPVRLK